MLRSTFCIVEIDSVRINKSISATTQSYLISILIVAGIGTLPEEYLGPLEGLYKELCIICKLWPEPLKY